jgi:hypothetical protein
MSLCRAGLVSALLLALALPTRAHAQVLGTGVLPVTEVGAQLWQSTITAGQSVLTATNRATTSFTLVGTSADFTRRLFIWTPVVAET